MKNKRIKLLLLTITLNLCFDSSLAVNHFVLSDDGTIQPKYDSPFYMQNPGDFMAFLNQSKYQELVDSLYSELMLIKTDLKAKFNDVESYAQGFIQQTKCIVQYFLQESDLMASIGTRKYLDRIYDQNNLSFKTSKEAKGKSPKCREYFDLDLSLISFDHLSAVFERRNLKMEKEEPLKLRELGFMDNLFDNMVTTGLMKDPKEWQFHVLASYFWRLQGNAFEALECARRAAFLSPISLRDVALLSMGTILQRSRRHSDAIVVLEAATDLNPNSAENFFALGNSLMFLSEFNKSLPAYERASTLDKAFESRVDHIKNSLVCFKYVKSRLVQIQSILKEIPLLLQKYQDKKTLLEDYLEKMTAQQVPIGQRDFFSSDNDDKVPQGLANLIERGQFCSTALSKNSKEVPTTVFCDFISDIRMKLEAEDISVDLINTYLEQTQELIATHTKTVGIFDQLNENNIGEKFENPEILYKEDNHSAKN